MVRLLAIVVAFAACGARSPAPARRAAGDDIALYRDVAVIRQRVELDVATSPAVLRVSIAAGVAADQVMLIDRGGLTITALHGQLDPNAELTAGEPEPPAIDDTDEDVDDPLDTHVAPPAAKPDAEAAAAAAAPRKPAKPTELRLDVTAPRPGKYAIVIGYVTNRIEWDVAYTLTATPQRDRGVLRGALAIRNTTGIALRAANARLIDAELGPWRGKTAEQLATALVGGTPASTAPAPARELGALAIGDGETRVELMPPSPRTMSSVLVYDPVGTKLDNPGASPLRDARLGVDVEKSTRVSESFEVARDTGGSKGLPAGPVRLLEHRSDGALVLLGESRLFEATARVANVDTIAVGTADGVTGTRERRELTIDDENRRLVEEFVITLDNQRAHEASVLVREHLYRGQNWSLAYHSAAAAAKEGPQQIALRAEVPARSQLKILYVVVYTWGQ
jgi:hypothetical protein